jgi:hypothetical protein
MDADNSRDYLYFTCDWLIERQGVELTYKPHEIATALNCPSWSTFEQSAEGYQLIRYFIRVPSKAILDEFVLQVKSAGLELNSWFPAPKMDFPEVPLDYTPTSIPAIQQANLDGLRYIAGDNERLREKLKIEAPLYFACNWVVPSILPSDWLEKILRTSWNLSYCEVRKGEINRTTDEGYYIQVFVVRVFSVEEFKRFVKDTEIDFSTYLSGKPKVLRESEAI